MPFNIVNAEDIYTHKHHSEAEYEYDNNPNKRQMSPNRLIIELFQILEPYYREKHKAIEVEFRNWWKKYQKISPTPYNGAGIFEIINAE